MKVEGIVLRLIKYKESSAIATVLTDDLGKISINCQRIYRNKNWVDPPALETMSITNFVLREGRTIYYLDEIESTVRMEAMARDHKVFFAGHIVAEILLKSLENEYQVTNIYPLTKTYLENLTEENAYYLTAAWIFKYLSLLGYRPYINTGEGYLYLSQSGIVSLSEMDSSGTILPVTSLDRDMVVRAMNSRFADIKDLSYDLFDKAVFYALLNLDLNKINSYELLKNWRYYE